MNPEIKAQWLTALRSGDYVQGDGALQSAEGDFCCLGVLCDLAVKAGVIEPPVSVETILRTKFAYDKATEYPPESVRKWAGLNSNNPGVVYNPYQETEPDYSRPTTLADLNDSHGFGFDRIADVIEEQL